MELFDEDTFMASLPERDKEVILALQALSLRFPPGLLDESKKDHLDSLARESRRLVMDRVTDGEAKLSSLQALCILSCYNFTCE